MTDGGDAAPSGVLLVARPGPGTGEDLRVASAVGERSTVVSVVHEALRADTAVSGI